MRASILITALAPLLVADAAYAGRTNGSSTGSSGGRLAQTSSGLGKATRSGGSSSTRSSGTVHSGSNSSEHDSHASRRDACRRHRGRYDRETARCYLPAPTSGTLVVERVTVDSSPPNTASLDLFVGGQKVYESDGSVSLSIAVVDRYLRFAGAISYYTERQMDGSKLAMTVPSLTLGARLFGSPSTRVFYEAGVANVNTSNDPMGDSSVTGATIGVHVDHAFSPTIAAVGDAHAMFLQSKVRGYSARLGARYRYLELAFRMLDLNVGPPLYGPELGLRF
ncbi:MAG: hypothetical protein AB7O24_20815 [Kofleriaceae bacterium]